MEIEMKTYHFHRDTKGVLICVGFINGTRSPKFEIPAQTCRFDLDAAKAIIWNATGDHKDAGRWAARFRDEVINQADDRGKRRDKITDDGVKIVLAGWREAERERRNVNC